MFSHTLAHGDVNGDGKQDLIVGAPRHYNAARYGAAYVIYGRERGDLALLAPIDLASEADVVITRKGVTDYVGASLACGDINGLGTDDMIVGSPTGNSTRAGVYIILGEQVLPPVIDLDSPPPGLQMVEVHDYLVGGLGNFGSSVAAGDVDGDGIDDVIIGNPGADRPGTPGNLTGRAYVLYGNSSLPTVIDINAPVPAIRRTRIYGDISGGSLGFGVAAGHVDEDGFADIIMGAPHADRGLILDVGRSYIIFGSPGLPDPIDLSSPSSGVVQILGCNDFSSVLTGSDNAAGDVDGPGVDPDRHDDVIIGAPWNQEIGMFRGVSYIVRGRDRSSFPAAIDLCVSDPTNLVKIYGASDGDHFGACINAGDLNLDGLSEVFVAAEFADSRNESRPSAGEIYIFEGAINFFSNPPTTAGAYGVIYGSTDPSGNGIGLGSAVTLIDMDNDGYPEIACGASRADVTEVSPERVDAGKALLVFSPVLLRHVYSQRIDLPLDPLEMDWYFVPPGLDPIRPDNIYYRNVFIGFEDPDNPVQKTDKPLIFYGTTLPSSNSLRMIKVRIVFGTDTIRVYY
jgi:hypothetical protein